MSEPFIGEIRMFPYSFPPQYWAYCNGQLLPISQNNVLYSIIGDMYGGDGQVTMGLPNLKGRVPMHTGQAPGLSNYVLAQYEGYPQIKIFNQQIPSHNHTAKGATVLAGTASPNGAYPTTDSSPSTSVYHQIDGNMSDMGSVTLDHACGMSNGDISAHENRQPYLAVPFCIALEGDYPPRN